MISPFSPIIPKTIRMHCNIGAYKAAFTTCGAIERLIEFNSQNGDAVP